MHYQKPQGLRQSPGQYYLLGQDKVTTNEVSWIDSHQIGAACLGLSDLKDGVKEMNFGNS